MSRRRLSTVVLAVMLLAPAASTPQEGSEAGAVESRSPAEIFVEANGAFEAGDFTAAASGYEALLGRGLSEAVVHYNLGNTRLRMGDLGAAIASFRSARTLSPRNQDVIANLAYARDSTQDLLEPPEVTATLRTLFFWHFLLSPDELWTILLLANVVLWSLGFAAVRSRRWPEWQRWAAALFLVLVVASGSSVLQRSLGAARVGVVMPQEVEVHSDSSATSAVRFLLHAGSEVRVSEERQEWLRIALPDGQQGWIEAASLEMVNG